MDAIILAAGSSTRMGEGNEKQLLRLGGKPMMVFAVQRILDHPDIDRVVLVVRDDAQALTGYLLARYQLVDFVTIVPGGSSRQESVWCGLQEVGSDRVLVHEAARPLISGELLDRVLAPSGPAVVPVVEIPFTVAIGTDVMEDQTDRSRLRNVQLPQAYDTGALRDAHVAAREQGLQSTEDSQLVFAQGHEVVFVEGATENIKVTYPFDLVVARSWLFNEDHGA